MSNHKHRPKKAVEVKPAGDPHPTTYLNYRGDTRGNIGRVMGPTLHGERLTVVEEIYDPAADSTAVGLAYGVHELVKA